MPIKSLHLTNAYHPASGGIRTFYRALIERANAEGRALRLVVPAEEDRLETVGTHGRIYHVRAPRSPAFDRRYRLILPHRFLWPRHGALWQILRDERPDLVEVSDKYSLLYFAGLIRKTPPQDTRPVLVGLSCERMDDAVAAYVHAGPVVRALARWYIGRLYMPMLDAHIAVSAYAADELVAAMRPRHARPVVLCPMGVEASAFGPERRSTALRSELERRTGGGCGAVLLLYAGRIAPEKHVGLLPALMARLTSSPWDIRLVVAGDGPLRAWLEEKCNRVAPGRVQFHGHITDRDELAVLLATCDLFVHPNPREPFGIGPLEAMASGLPVVAPEAGGVLSYANRNNAWLAAPDAESFAVAIHDALSDPETLALRRTNALETAREHDWPAVAARILRTYDEIHAVWRATSRLQTNPGRYDRVAVFPKSRSATSVSMPRSMPSGPSGEVS
jgi:alpha-1,6-mannosyltransferase